MIAQNSIRESKERQVQQLVMNDSLDQYKKEFQKMMADQFTESNVSSIEKAAQGTNGISPHPNKLQRITALQYSYNDKATLIDKELQLKQVQLENEALK